MTYKFEFRLIARRFLRSLTTSHGSWDIRESIIIRLIDRTGRDGWGEIAPISWFGSETLEQALDFCRQIPQEITEETIYSIPDHLPACRFGFESAWEDCKKKDTWRKGNAENKIDEFPASSSLAYSGLLPAGEAALSGWEKLWEEGYRTFKWKIGVNAIADELGIFHLLIHSLPASTKLRLDANAGLSYEEAMIWLENCDKFPENIEFIEQPLAVDELEAMLHLSKSYSTAIALDESVATLSQLRDAYQRGWREIFVIKPGIVGSPSQLRQFCQEHNIDAVFSSVFETAIGRQAALQLAAELSQHNRAVGFGIDHLLEKEEDRWLQRLWQNP